MDDRILSFLSGSDLSIGRISTYCQFYSATSPLHDAFINENFIERGKSFFERGGRVLQIAGAGGRRFIARHIAQRIKTDFIFIDLLDITGNGTQNYNLIKNELVREALFLNAGVCIYGITDEITGNDNEHKLELLERDILTNFVRWDIPLIVCSDTSRPLVNKGDSRDCLILELPKSISFDERKRIWENKNRIQYS